MVYIQFVSLYPIQVEAADVAVREKKWLKIN
jgi:hypothetical protein